MSPASTTSRLLVMAAAVVALTVPSGSVFAQDQHAASVDGTSTLVGTLQAGTTTIEDGVIRLRDSVLVTIEEATDPRVSGRASISVNFDAYPDAEGRTTQVRFGSMRLVNDDGWWEGRFTGKLSARGFDQTYWLSGSGAYEGLSYVVTAFGSGPVWQSHGLIYPGELPPQGRVFGFDLDGPGPEQPAA
jgi:hypothetical protein